MIKLKMLIGKEEKIYEGRFLGFLKDDEFNALVQRVNDLAGRIESKPSQSIVEVARSVSDLPGTRLVMVVKKSGSETELRKKLLVSPRCDYISCLSNNEVIIETLDGDTDTLVIEEVKDEK